MKIHKIIRIVSYVSIIAVFSGVVSLLLAENKKEEFVRTSPILPGEKTAYADWPSNSGAGDGGRGGDCGAGDCN